MYDHGLEPKATGVGVSSDRCRHLGDGQASATQNVAHEIGGARYYMDSSAHQMAGQSPAAPRSCNFRAGIRAGQFGCWGGVLCSDLSCGPSSVNCLAPQTLTIR